MNKVRPSQVFDFETEEHVVEAGQRTSDPSPSPTLDKRANLYLNAVYGAREFNGEEHSYARDIILGAMAIDVGAGRKDISEDVHAHENSTPSGHHPAAFRLDDAHVFSAFDTRDYARRRPSPARVEIETFDRDLEWEADVEATPVSRGPPRTLPRQKARRGSFVLFSAIAGCLVFAAIMGATLPLVLRTESAKTNTIAQFSPGEFQSLLSPNSSRQVVETVVARSPASSEFAGRLFDLGNKLVAGGDMYGGRLILQEAANEGNASAALALGATFDPIEATALGQRDSSPDVGKARAWYSRAKQLGSTEAQARLNRLAKDSR
jgi:hypothetical protein